MKKMYKKPETGTIVMPKSALMEFQASPNIDPHHAPARNGEVID